MNKFKSRYHVLSMLAIAICMLAYGCDSLSRSQKGAAIGAGAGTVVGAFIGKSAGNTALGAIIGGAVGGTAGAYIGKQMDRQATEITQSVPGAKVIRVDDGIMIRFAAGILFDKGGAELKPEAKTDLRKLAESIRKNSKTHVLIVGYTDSTGSVTHNMELSIQRAEAVKAWIAAAKVDTSRLTAEGKGSANPIATNTTEDGRAQNRRVDIIIRSAAEMRKQANLAAAEK